TMLCVTPPATSEHFLVLRNAAHPTMYTRMKHWMMRPTGRVGEELVGTGVIFFTSFAGSGMKRSFALRFFFLPFSRKFRHGFACTCSVFFSHEKSAYSVFCTSSSRHPEFKNSEHHSASSLSIPANIASSSSVAYGLTGFSA